MKVRELLEEIHVDAPLVVSIINSLIEKGEPVKMYYRGDGGVVGSVEWADAVSTFNIPWMGSNHVVKIPDAAIDDMQLRQVDKKSWRFTQTTTRQVGEGVDPVDEWAARADAEFKQMLKRLGWRLYQNVLAGTTAHFGGTIRLVEDEDDGILTVNQQLEMMLRALAVKLLTYAAAGQKVVIGRHQHDSVRVNADDTVPELAEHLRRAIESMHVNGKSISLYWSIQLPAELTADLDAKNSALFTSTAEQP